MKPNDPDYMLVRVADYDPKWPEMFEAEAALVREIIGDNLITIFHIGSTAVPGLKAKPVIDMLPVVRDVEALGGLTREFDAAGYEAMGEFGLPGRRYFRKGGALRRKMLHTDPPPCCRAEGSLPDEEAVPARPDAFLIPLSFGIRRRL